MAAEEIRYGIPISPDGSSTKVVDLDESPYVIFYYDNNTNLGKITGLSYTPYFSASQPSAIKDKTIGISISLENGTILHTVEYNLKYSSSTNGNITWNESWNRGTGKPVIVPASAFSNKNYSPKQNIKVAFDASNRGIPNGKGYLANYANSQTLVITYEKGVQVYYGVNGEWKPVTVYYGVNGGWKEAQAVYGTGGVWKP